MLYLLSDLSGEFALLNVFRYLTFRAGGAVITLRHLAIHSSGLPRLPPIIAAAPGSAEPEGKYNHDKLLRDL